MVQKNGQVTRRVLILTTVRSYRNQDFIAAAKHLGIELILGVNMPDGLSDSLAEGFFPLAFDNQDDALKRIVAFAEHQPLSAVLSADDSGSVLAARAGAALNLKHNEPDAARATRDKYRMRESLFAAGLPSPHFRRFTNEDDVEDVVGSVRYPCVIKPLNLNGSRGVIRADSPAELREAIGRLLAILRAIYGAEVTLPFIIEDFIPGIEVAIEGIMHSGELKVLALFDKPDPLDGPYFEETIYVTPSRLLRSQQRQIASTVSAAAKAIGLKSGPVHAECRLNESGVWMIEIAGRTIGGLCGRILRFGSDAPLEELVLREATGQILPDLHMGGQARGVMMIPIPKSGLLRRIEGLEQARSVALIEDIEITARQDMPLRPLPEGDSYLGFIFSRGPSPDEVEQSLRLAHQQLIFEIDPLIQLQTR